MHKLKGQHLRVFHHEGCRTIGSATISGSDLDVMLKHLSGDARRDDVALFVSEQLHREATRRMAAATAAKRMSRVATNIAKLTELLKASAPFITLAGSDLITQEQSAWSRLCQAYRQHRHVSWVRRNILRR
jgi:hypothetical protein